MANHTPYRSADSSALELANTPSIGLTPGQAAAARWAQARERLQGLGQEPWSPPPPDSADGWMDLVVSDDGRMALLLCPGTLNLRAYFVDLATMAVRMLAVPGLDRDTYAGIRADGSVVVLVSEQTLMVVEPWSPEPLGLRSVALAAQLSLSRMSDNAVAVHPSAPLVAIGMEEGGTLVADFRTGRVVQRYDAAGGQGVAFSPDGEWLACCSDDRCQVFSTGGRQRELAAKRIAFDPTGAHVAIVWSEGDVLEILPLDGTWPAAGPRRGVSFAPPRYEDDRGEVEALRFSPDGMQLGVFFMAGPQENERQHQLSIVEVSTGQILDTVTNPVHPPRGVGSLSGMGFDRSGDRVLASTRRYRSKHHRGPENAVWIYSIAQRRHLGSLGLQSAVLTDLDRAQPEAAREFLTFEIRPDDDEIQSDDVLVGRTDAGPHGRLALEAPLDGRAYVLPLESPALTRQLLRGHPAGHATQGPLADLAERFDFFAEQAAAGALADQTSLSELVEVTRGLTHLLPAVMEHARSIVASGPRFGPGPVHVDAAATRAAAQQLGALPAAQRDELFERQQVAVAKQAESRAIRQQAALVRLRFKWIVARVSVVVLLGLLVGLVGLVVLG